jgi:hypothetical protein
VSGRLDVRGWSGVTVVPGARRVVRVLSTSRSTFSAPLASPGGRARIVEGDEGGGYRIATSAGLVAVYALAGTEDAAGAFTPQRMGIARRIRVAPGEERSGVDLALDVALDATFTARLDTPHEPSGTLSVTLAIEEGYFAPDGAAGLPRDAIVDGHVVALGGQPALAGPLADARYDVVAVDAQGTCTATRRIRALAAQDVVIGEFLAPPIGLSPLDAPFEGTLAWSAGGAPATFVYGVLYDANVTWRLFGPRDLTEAVLPELEDFGIPRPIDGMVEWAVTRFVVPGADYATLSLGDFHHATHEAACAHVARW